MKRLVLIFTLLAIMAFASLAVVSADGTVQTEILSMNLSD